MKCDCRKPAPGMLLHAAAEHGIALARSWMLGDGLTDVQAGRAAGCRTLLLTRLKVNLLEKCFDLTGREPDCTAADFDAALACLRGASS
jgi:histidinol phosphatase-like enzyme